MDILRVQYGLEPTDEDIRYGHKFSFALYFDRNLNFLADMTFFTESAYIRYFENVPHENEFQEFEEKLKNPTFTGFLARQPVNRRGLMRQCKKAFCDTGLLSMTVGCRSWEM